MARKNPVTKAAPVAEERRTRNLLSDLPAGRSPVLRVVPMPADSNQHGDIFGGWIMAQVDIAGGVVAAIRARGRVATVAVNSFTFKEPVLIVTGSASMPTWSASGGRRSPSTSRSTPNGIRPSARSSR